MANIHGVDVMPMAGITGSVAIPVTKRVSVEFNAIGNYFVNHGNVGIKIGF